MFYFVRHGETEWNVKDIRQGWSQNPLNANGVRQIKDATDGISKLPIAYFYCSDLLRARQSADIINKALKLEIIYDERLREISSGDWHGKIRSEQTEEEIEDFNKDRRKYNAETWQDVFDRAKSFMAEMTEKQRDGVLVVSHGGLINMMRYCAKCETFDEKAFFDVFFEFANAEVIEIDFYK